MPPAGCQLPLQFPARSFLDISIFCKKIERDVPARPGRKLTAER
jgi:hypothetical protein